MQITISEVDENNLVTLSYESEPGRAKEAYDKTLKKLGGSVTIKGFRKGKAPKTVLEEYFGVENVKAETLSNDFLSQLLDEAIREKDLSVVNIDKIEKVDFQNPEEAIAIEAKVELFPEVKLPEFSDIKVKVQIPKFDIEEKYQQTIEKVRLKDASFVESDQALEMGDEIVFDFDGSFQKEDGEWEAKAGMKSEGFQTIVESGRFIDGFLEQMIGMKKDEEKELLVKFPETYHDAELSGKDAKFKVKVNKISKAEKPELNEDYAKQLGFDSLEAMQNKVREELEQVSESNKKHYTGEAVATKLVEMSEMKLSKAMIDREIHHELALMQQQNKWSDDEVKDFTKTLDMEQERAKASQKLERSVALTTIIREHKLEANEEDIQAAFANLNLPPDFDTSKMHMPSVINKLNLDILTTKAIELISESAEIEYEEVDEKDFIEPGEA